jgi:tetratricopeptide (TPR) repeat protein
VTAAYRQVITEVPYRADHVVDALLWLSGHLSADAYGQAVREFAGGSRVLSYDVRRAAGRFAQQGDWTAFERFLDALFSGMDPKQQSTYSCLSAAWVALQGNEPWAGRFLEYCRSRRTLAPHLFRQQEKQAAKHIEQNDHEKAAEIYRAIAAQCGPHETQIPYEYKICECVFHANRHGDALQALEAFINQYGRHDRAGISSAMMLKGRCHVNLSQVDEAIDTFFDLLIRYPHSAAAAEANFLMGYCLIIQGRFQDATEALKLVVQDYPQSEYAAKAHLYLDRMKTMAK